jgi:hypothetical protein
MEESSLDVESVGWLKVAEREKERQTYRVREGFRIRVPCANNCKCIQTPIYNHPHLTAMKACDEKFLIEYFSLPPHSI